MANKMTFHESYGDLPVKTLSLIKRHNVAPADFYLIEDQFGLTANTPAYVWLSVDLWIVNNLSASGMYQHPFNNY